MSISLKHVGPGEWNAFVNGKLAFTVFAPDRPTAMALAEQKAKNDAPPMTDRLMK